MKDDAPHLGINNRRQVQTFYDAMVEALRRGELTPEGGAIPTSLNTLIALLPGKPSLLKRDRDVTDWSVENDEKFAAFLNAWRAEHGEHARKPVAKRAKPRAIAAPLYQAVSALQETRTRSVKKAELERAVDSFLQVYALSEHALKLPKIDLALPQSLPEGIELDESRVTLGADDKGSYVGLVRRRGKSSSE